MNEIHCIRGIKVNLFMDKFIDGTFIVHIFSVKCAQYFRNHLDDVALLLKLPN